MVNSNLVMVYVGERSYLMDLYRKEFKKKGVKVHFFESFIEVQGFLKRDRADIVLVNINNTRLDCCQLIRKLSYQSKLPVVAIGVVSSEKEKKNFVNVCGASAFIEEPLAIESCLEEVKKILNQRSRVEPRLQADQSNINAKVFCTFDSLTVECQLVDLSTHGMKVLCPQKIPSGRRLYFVVKLELNREVFTLNTETMIESSNDTRGVRGMHAYRILFVNLSAKEEDLLRGLINSYVKGDPSFAYY